MIFVIMILSICLIFVVAFGIHQFITTSDYYITPKKPTNLDKLIAAYMKRDTCDPTSTINFLLDADNLKNPFDEAPILPPPKPSDAAYSARPHRVYRDQLFTNLCSCSAYDKKMTYDKKMKLHGHINALHDTRYV